MHIGKDTSDIRVYCCDADEGTDITITRDFEKAHHRHTHKRHTRIEDKDDTSLAILIREPRCRAEPDAGESIRRKRQHLRHGGRVSHPGLQDDGQEVAEGVCYDVVEEEDPGEFPYLPVLEVDHDRLEGQRLGRSVATIAVNALHDEVGFMDCQERLSQDEASFVCLVWKVDDGDKAHDAEHDGYNTLLLTVSSGAGSFWEIYLRLSRLQLAWNSEHKNR